jgi:hypothetical protein
LESLCEAKLLVARAPIQFSAFILGCNINRAAPHENLSLGRSRRLSGASHIQDRRDVDVTKERMLGGATPVHRLQDVCKIMAGPSASCRPDWSCVASISRRHLEPSEVRMIDGSRGAQTSSRMNGERVAMKIANSAANIATPSRFVALKL